MWKIKWNKPVNLLLGLVLLLFSCQSAYDKLLMGTDVDLKLETALEFYEQEDYYKAQQLFEQVMPYKRGTPQIDTIYYKYSYTHYYLNNYILASYYFKNFTQTFTSSPFLEDAFYMTAFANYQLSPNYKLDQTYTLQAIDGFQLFANRYPTSGKVPTCNALIDEMRAKLEEKAVASAELYYKLGNFQSADKAYRNLLIDYPDSEDTEKIRYRIVQASFKLAENTIQLKQAERFEQVVGNANDFKKRHPESQYINDVEGYLKSAQVKMERLTVK